MEDFKRKLYLDLLYGFGHQAQIDQCNEEMAELIVALNKYKRKANWQDITFTTDVGIEQLRKAVVTEIADVKILLEQMEMLFCKEGEMEAEVNRKLHKARGYADKAIQVKYKELQELVYGDYEDEDYEDWGEEGDDL